MARPARFTDDDILDGAARVLAGGGTSVTMAAVGREVGAPTGSIYHRFASRDDLLARLWVRSIRRFHEGLLEAYDHDDPREAVRAAARHIPEHCRARPVDALGMTLFRRDRLAAQCSADLRPDVEHINDAIDAAQRDLVRRRYGRVTQRRLELMNVATRQSPYGLVRPYVGGDVPAWLDDVVVAATEAIAALGD